MRKQTWSAAISAAAIVVSAATSTFATPTPENTPDYFVEWVQPNGKLYVDTGIIAKDGIKAETYLQHVKTEGVTYPAMLGAFFYTGNKRFIPCGFANNEIRLQYGTSYNDVGPGSVPYGDECLIETEYPVGSQLTSRATKHNGSITNAVLNGATKGGPIDTGISLYLFAVHMYRSNNSYAQDFHTGRLYYCKIWQTNGVDAATYVPVRDYRPCVKDGVACVYDAVSETISYPMQDTLKAGPAIPDGWPAAARTGNVDHPATQWGKIKRNTRVDMWRYAAPYEYQEMGDGDIANLNGNKTSWQKNHLSATQLRFDGWFQVSADKAGAWSINQRFDDYFAFFIDGRNVLYNNTYTSEENATVSVSEGWHRFTIVCGDTSGGYGSYDRGGGIGVVPFKVTVGGAAYAFNNTNFPQGSGSNSLTLDADADWSSTGPTLLSGGAVLDLNGHNLTVAGIASDGFVGAMVTNSAATRSVLYFTGDSAESMAIANRLVKGVGEGIVLAKAGEKIAFWTGAANNGVATDPANWRDTSGASVTPDGTYDVKLVGQNVNLQIPVGSTFACKTLDIGDCTFTANCDWSGLSLSQTTPDYISAPLGAYIDTGFAPNQDTRVVMEVSVQGTYEYWFGAWDVAMNDNAFAACNDGGNVYTGYGNTGGGYGMIVPNGRHTIDFDKGVLKIDGVVHTTRAASTFQLARTLYLFAQNRKGTAKPHDSQHAIHCHSCKVYDNGTLVRDYVPAREGTSFGFRERCGGAFATSSSAVPLGGFEPATTLSGTANLAGHVLTLPALAAKDGATLAGGEGSAVAFPVDETTLHGSLREDEYIADIGNLALSDDAKIVLVKDGAGGTLSATTMWLGEAHNAEFAQTNGTVNLGSTRTYLGGKLAAGGHGVYRMSGGKLVSAGEFTLGAKGTAEFVQTGGDITFQSWFNIGRHGGTGTYTVTGGSMTNTYSQPLYLGCEGGTGTLNASGNASLEVHQLILGGWNNSAAGKGYLNLSGNATLVSRGMGLAGRYYAAASGEVNQTGGKLQIGAEFSLGYDSTGVYNMSGGDFTSVGHLYVGRNASGNGTFTQNGGTVAPKDVRVGESDGATGLYTLNSGTVKPLYWTQIGPSGVGRFVQNGGEMLIEGVNDNKLQLADKATGYGTYIINDGLLRVQNGIVAGRLGKGVFEMNGGTVVTTNITCGTGTSVVTLNAGTIKPTGSGTFIGRMDALTFGRDIKIDTDSFDVSVAGETVATEGSVLTKKGEGTLTFAAPPPVGTLKVERGTVAFAAGGDNTAAASLAHRWSFNGSTEAENLRDSVDASLSATKIGSEVAFSDGAAVMTGNGNSTGSLNLGVGIVPKECATIEIWATRTAYRKYARIFDFAVSTTNYMFMSWYMSGSSTKDRIEIYGDGVTTRQEATMAYANNEKYHIAMTLVANADGSTTASWTQRDAGTGDLLGSGTFTRAGWTLARLADGVFYLGHSAFTGDADAHAKYDEVRIWHGALSDDALTLSAQKGPDATAEDIAAIVAKNDEAATVGRSVEIASGATLDLGGNTLVQPVVKGSGTIATGVGGSLVVSDKMVVNVGECLEASGTIDLSNAKLELVDPANLTVPFTFLKPVAGQTLTVTGVPTPSNLPKGWKVSVAANGTGRIVKKGLMLIVR